jgi:REP element-mobilizing transposase RayT
MLTKCKVVELNVLIDHVHLVVRTPPNVSVSELMGILKGEQQYDFLRGSYVFGKRSHGATTFGSVAILWTQWERTTKSSDGMLGFRTK